MAYETKREPLPAYCWGDPALAIDRIRGERKAERKRQEKEKVKEQLKELFKKPR